jgi:hypothetical protein
VHGLHAAIGIFRLLRFGLCHIIDVLPALRVQSCQQLALVYSIAFTNADLGHRPEYREGQGNGKSFFNCPAVGDTLVHVKWLGFLKADSNRELRNAVPICPRTAAERQRYQEGSGFKDRHDESHDLLNMEL